MKNKKKLKICIISNSAGKSGGAERTLPKFAQSLQIKGVDVLVIIPSKGDMLDELKKFDIDYLVLPYRMWMHEKSSFLKKLLINFINLIILIPLSIKIICWKCDVVLSNTITVSVGAFAAKLTGRQHVWYIREFGYEDHGRTFDLGKNFSYWLINRLGGAYIFNSSAVKEKYQKILSSDKLRVIYEGYITQEQINNKDKVHQTDKKVRTTKRCLMIGTLQEGKGHKDAIKSIGKLKQEGISVILDILGTGYNAEYKSELLELISHYNIRDNVFFYGYVENPFSFLENSDIFLMCSRNEAFGIVTAEAMQCGIAVIGSKSGGTKELILDGFNGFLYSPGNIDELADKIKYLINNPDTMNKFANNGRDWVFNNLTFDKYTNEMLDALNHTLMN